MGVRIGTVGDDLVADHLGQQHLGVGGFEVVGKVDGVNRVDGGLEDIEEGLQVCIALLQACSSCQATQDARRKGRGVFQHPYDTAARGQQVGSLDADVVVIRFVGDRDEGSTRDAAKGVSDKVHIAGVQSACSQVDGGQGQSQVEQVNHALTQVIPGIGEIGQVDEQAAGGILGGGILGIHGDRLVGGIGGKAKVTLKPGDRRKTRNLASCIGDSVFEGLQGLDRLVKLVNIGGATA